MSMPTSTADLPEIINSTAPFGSVRYVLFDFDGTLSLIREGWQEVMVPFFVEELLATPSHEGEAELTRVVREFVTRLTGKQTIYQCFQLAEEVAKRGGGPKEPLAYKHAYLERLWSRIAHRVQALREGSAQPDTYLVRGSRALLEELKRREVLCYLASGTDLPYVRDEAAALQIDHFFGPRIYGALDDYRRFSKQMIIEQILRENSLHGPELAVIGDGYVEIENGKGVGGLAIGVASDERNPGGLDEWKRERLIHAGADVIVRDFANLPALVNLFFAD